MERALRGHYPEFGEMATYRIDGLGPLTHRKIADTKHNGRSLLLFALHRYEPHRRPLRRFSTPSQPPNAPITSPTPDTNKPKLIML